MPRNSNDKHSSQNAKSVSFKDFIKNKINEQKATPRKRYDYVDDLYQILGISHQGLFEKNKQKNSSYISLKSYGKFNTKKITINECGALSPFEKNEIFIHTLGIIVKPFVYLYAVVRFFGDLIKHLALMALECEDISYHRAETLKSLQNLCECLLKSVLAPIGNIITLFSRSFVTVIDNNKSENNLLSQDKHNLNKQNSKNARFHKDEDEDEETDISFINPDTRLF